MVVCSEYTFFYWYPTFHLFFCVYAVGAVSGVLVMAVGGCFKVECFCVAPVVGGHIFRCTAASFSTRLSTPFSVSGFGVWVVARVLHWENFFGGGTGETKHVLFSTPYSFYFYFCSPIFS